MKTVIIDIAGVCNASCPHCPTGSKSHKTSGFMSYDIFKDVLKKVVDNFEVKEIALYNWGEPMLHPELKKITEEFDKYEDLKYSLSTNCGVIQPFTEKMARNCKSITFSMCGFTQTSYDRIHQLSIEKVKANIKTLVANIREYTDEVEFSISYHIYKFNSAEVAPATKFANSLNIEMVPYYAYINDLFKVASYYSGTMDTEGREHIDSDIYVEKITERKSKMISTTDRTKCFIKHFLVISHTGDVMVSTCIPYGDDSFVLGKFLDMTPDELQKLEGTFAPFCKECLEKGYDLCITRFEPVNLKNIIKKRKQIRKWLVQIKLRKDVQVIRLFGHYFLNKHK